MFTLKFKGQKNGVTLIEIMLAMVILAMAFIPIMGVMGTSVKATDKDNRTIKAIEMCQKKLNKALQFPFKSQLTPPVGGSFTFGGVASETKKAGNIFLQLGPNTTEDGFKFITTLTTEDIGVNFHVPVYDPLAKEQNPNNPAMWGWGTADQVIPYTGVFTKYTMKIQWKDAGNNKFYTLVSFKAKSEI